MKIRRTIAAAVAATALVGVAGASVAQAAPARPSTATTLGTRPLATVLSPYGSKWDTNWNDYNIVAHAVNAVLAKYPTSAVKALTQGNVALTAFIPTDGAFRDFVYHLTGHLYSTESQVFGAVASLGLPTVQNVLLYHVVPGSTIPAATALTANGAVLSTALSGATFRLFVLSSPTRILLVDKDPYFVNPTVVLSQTNINLGNKQIAHGISRVLIPLAGLKNKV